MPCFLASTRSRPSILPVVGSPRSIWKSVTMTLAIQQYNFATRRNLHLEWTLLGAPRRGAGSTLTEGFLRDRQNRTSARLVASAVWLTVRQPHVPMDVSLANAPTLPRRGGRDFSEFACWHIQ